MAYRPQDKLRAYLGALSKNHYQLNLECGVEELTERDLIDTLDLMDAFEADLRAVMHTGEQAIAMWRATHTDSNMPDPKAVDVLVHMISRMGVLQRAVVQAATMDLLKEGEEAMHNEMRRVKGAAEEALDEIGPDGMSIDAPKARPIAEPGTVYVEVYGRTMVGKTSVAEALEDTLLREGLEVEVLNEEMIDPVSGGWKKRLGIVKPKVVISETRANRYGRVTGK